jgi:hypothetical protein
MAYALPCLLTLLVALALSLTAQVHGPDSRCADNPPRRPRSR